MFKLINKTLGKKKGLVVDFDKIEAIGYEIKVR